MGVDERLLISGVTLDTYATSGAAAVENNRSARAAQRALVYQTIRDAADYGRTDDELQIELDLDGNSERPRRWELMIAGFIAVKRDAQGFAVKRLTRTNRQAVVWVMNWRTV